MIDGQENRLCWAQTALLDPRSESVGRYFVYTYVGDLDALGEPEFALGLNGVQLAQDFPGVGGERDQHGQLGQRHQAHVGLGVGAQLGLRHQIHRILLGLQTRRQEIAIPHVLAIVHTK